MGHNEVCRTPPRRIGRALAGGVVVALAVTACTTTVPDRTDHEPGHEHVGVGPGDVEHVGRDEQLCHEHGGPDPARHPASRPARSRCSAGLDIAWSVAVLPDGSALVSERNTGRIHHVPKPGSRRARPPSPDACRSRGHGEGEGGLLGLAVPEDFDADPVLYAYYSTDSDNRIAAVPWRDGTIGDPVVIFSGIPSGRNHNGGRIAFGPDGYLYVGTGEAGDTSLAQNLDSLGGKILRITPDGDPAPGNPFGGSPIWSYGHRNVQGLAWDSRKRLWASEFGQNTYDELNLIEAGKNYGWPDVEGRRATRTTSTPLPSGPTVRDVAERHRRRPRRRRLPGRPARSSRCGACRSTPTARPARPPATCRARTAASATSASSATVPGSRRATTTGADRLISLPLSAVGAG